MVRNESDPDLRYIREKTIENKHEYDDHDDNFQVADDQEIDSGVIFRPCYFFLFTLNGESLRVALTFIIKFI